MKSTHFEHKAFDASPEDDDTSRISNSDANTEITDVDSEGAGTTKDVAYQTISSSKMFSHSGLTAKTEQNFTKHDK